MPSSSTKLTQHLPVRRIIAALVLAAALVATGSSIGQEENSLPTGVAALQFGHGTRLTDTLGFTLYQYDNDLKEPGSSTCIGDCAIRNPPLISTNTPEDMPAGWSLINREDGMKQLAYQGMPMYRFVRDSHKGAAFGEGGGWTVAFDPILTPPQMSINKTVLGHVLAAQNGLTLYTLDDTDSTNSYECNKACLETWLPLEAPWAAVESGDFSVQRREDGVYQWSYKKQPLYLYAKESASGDTNGHGVDGVWTAMILEPAPPIPDWVRIVGSDGGTLYANSSGMTLYTLNQERNNDPMQALGSNVCDQQCLIDGWQPVEAQSLVQSVGNWSVIENEDQTLQWAHLGKPVYTSKNEVRKGELIATTRREYQWLKPIMYELPALQGVFN